jgi:urease accessory protein
MTSTAMIDNADLDWLPALAIWLSPAYPVGAYSFSHGLEWAVEAGWAHDRASLQNYVGAALEWGGGFVDLALLAATWRARRAGDASALEEIVDLARALRPTAELALEAGQQGAAFVAATRAAWPDAALDELGPEALSDLPYPVAVGAACAYRAPLAAALLSFAHAFAANLVSAGVRLIPLGQTDGQRALAALVEAMRRAAARAAEVSLDELGSSAPVIEIGSMRHETQYTRLFRS